MADTTVTRATLANAIHRKYGFSETESALIVNSIINLVCRGLSNGDKVNITNFGSFQLKRKNPRKGRNPKTLQEYPISGRNVIKFTISKKLKEKIKDKYEKHDDAA